MEFAPFVESNDSLGTKTDEEILLELEENILIIFMMMMACIDLTKKFNCNELEEGRRSIVNHNTSMNDILASARVAPPLFKVLTNVFIQKVL